MEALFTPILLIEKPRELGVQCLELGSGSIPRYAAGREGGGKVRKLVDVMKHMAGRGRMIARNRERFQAFTEDGHVTHGSAGPRKLQASLPAKSHPRERFWAISFPQNLISETQMAKSLTQISSPRGSVRSEGRLGQHELTNAIAAKATHLLVLFYLRNTPRDVGRSILGSKGLVATRENFLNI